MNISTEEAEKKYGTQLPPSLIEETKEILDEEEKTLTIRNPDLKSPEQIASELAEDVAPGPDEDEVIPDVLPEKVRDYEHMYNVLDGKYKKDLGDLGQKVDGLGENLRLSQETIFNQNELIRSIKATPPVKPEEVPAPPPKVTKVDIDELVEEESIQLGEKVNTLIDEIEELKSQSAETAGKMETTERVVQSTAQTAAEQAWKDHLDKLTAIPNYGPINDDPKFQEWLGDVGLENLRGKHNAMDSEAIKKTVETFVRVTGWESSDSDQIITEGLESQVVPESGAAGQGLKPKQKTGKVTDAMYNKATVDFTAGRITEDEWERVSLGYSKTKQEEMKGK